LGKLGDVFAVHFHQGQGAGEAVVNFGVDRLDQRAFPGPPRPPEQGVVGGESAGEAPAVVEQLPGLTFDAPQQVQFHPVDQGDAD